MAKPVQTCSSLTLCSQLAGTERERVLLSRSHAGSQQGDTRGWIAEVALYVK